MQGIKYILLVAIFGLSTAIGLAISKTYENRVIFADGSWKDEVAYYNASTGKLYYTDTNVKYTTEEIKEINDKVNNKISMSNLAIKKNYFNYLENEKKKYVIEQKPEDETGEEENTE